MFYVLPFSVKCFLEHFTTQAFILGSPIKNEPDMSLPPMLNQTNVGVLQKTSFSELTLGLAYAGLEGGVGWAGAGPLLLFLHSSNTRHSKASRMEMARLTLPGFCAIDCKVGRFMSL